MESDSNRPLREHAPTFIAHRFHDVYEDLAPLLGYKTREASAVPWDQVPATNRRLMEKVVTKLIAEGTVIAGPKWREHMAQCARPLASSRERNGEPS